MRIAFLTPEFVTDMPDRGGLASYLLRMVAALRDAGHTPEVFTIGDRRGVAEHEGLRVETVPPARNAVVLAVEKAMGLVGVSVKHSAFALRGAMALANAFERRHAAEPFDAVQSANCLLPGLFARRRKGRAHVVRCSSDRTLWTQSDRGALTFDVKLLSRLERAAMNRADRCYAPSRFLAEHFRRSYGCDVGVVRPPLSRAAPPVGEPGVPLPPKYFVHFGRMGLLKGTDLVAKAVGLARRECPGLCCVCAGSDSSARPFDALCEGVDADGRAGLRYVGALPRPALNAVVRGAVASVLPSRADNIPNTVLESLMLGVPVIGSHGASIDELVEPGASGELVPIGDADALARAMVDAWRGEAPWVGEGFRPPALDEFEPRNAVESLLAFVKPMQKM